MKRKEIEQGLITRNVIYSLGGDSGVGWGKKGKERSSEDHVGSSIAVNINYNHVPVRVFIFNFTFK